MTTEELIKLFEDLKTAHELPNDNTTEYNLGYVDAIRLAMNQIEKLDLHLVSISLLKKYMAHVMDNEGVSFVGYANDAYSNIKFTDNELETLKSINEEIVNEY